MTAFVFMGSRPRPGPPRHRPKTGPAEDVLDELVDDAAAAGSSCLANVRNGRVVVEANWPRPQSSPREVFSVTKPVTSMLVGIAETRGELSISQRVSRYVPEWRDTHAAEVTIENILTGLSDRHWRAGAARERLADGES